MIYLAVPKVSLFRIDLILLGAGVAYGLDGRGFDPRYGLKYFSLLQNVQSGSGTHRGSIPGVKRPGREVNHSFLISVIIENKWSYASTPPYMPSWRGQGKTSMFLFTPLSV